MSVRSLASVVVLLAAALSSLPRVRGEEITIYRDEFGIPHIYAETLAGASFAAGYAQAEDRLEQLLQNYRLAAGTIAEIAGPDLLDQDYRTRIWEHERVCRENFGKLDPKLQASCRAYVQGIQKFMADHPDQVPPWAQQLEPHHPVMLGRFIIWGWPEGQADDDLEKIGIKRSPEVYRGSNEWIVSPQRSAAGGSIALIDPHLSWYGPFRFYEQRMYAPQDDFALSGAAILGVPMPGLGHTQFASIAMTTGGPDTADIYEETINPENPLEYLLDGQWKKMTERVETIRIRTQDGVVSKDLKVHATHRGPIVARQGNKAYSMVIPYVDQIGLIEELYKFHTARTLDEVKQALASRQLMPQNVMVATVEGDTFYVRTGRVPKRNHGHPSDRPIPGDKSANDYDGVHPFEDLVQITNPATGYMQNCNISPAHLMKESPLVPEKYARQPYLYNADPGPAHQRGRMVLELLHADDSVTLEDAFEIAFSTHVWAADQWQARLRKAWEQATAEQKSGDAAEMYERIQKWNRKSDPDSQGALCHYAFKMALGGAAAEAVEVPADITDAQLLAALAQGAELLRAQPRAFESTYGDLFRVARQGAERSFPVGGGSVKEAGMATPRAISFHKGNPRIGHGGQTSTQIVVLSKPPKSYMVIPLGQSDHKQSGHWDDQAEKLFSPGKAKDTYFLDRGAVEKHATATKKLTF
ncbi:MAG: penicillin acylase family protein [Planctomycetaceae bacterium]|nr:penicillin acylase family protein [Planctomycetaceae bacterium]